MMTRDPNKQAGADVGCGNAARILIVADDLTGACDSGVAFLSGGRRARVTLEPPSDAGLKACLEAESGADVVAFTTATRNLSEEQAEARVAELASALRRAGRRSIVFKKIDSAARGHLGVETMAARRGSEAVIALVAPSFPEAGRTVHSGVLNVRDCSGQDVKIALRDQFPGVGAARIETLPASLEPELVQSIRSAIAKGTQILICDAETREDLERLAAAALQVQDSILWVGSAGLARALAAQLPASARQVRVQVPQRTGRTLLFVGTEHPVTGLQLSHVEKLDGWTSTIFRIDWPSAAASEIRVAFAVAPVSALILTGGDTAAWVLEALDARGIVLAGELVPGIPWGFVEGGMADKCVVVTKSGGFGEHNALALACEFCDRRLYELA